MSDVWCSDRTNSIPAVSGWDAKGLGKGQANTTAMLGVCASGAANKADLYLTATRSDWFLPSQRELMMMYNNLGDAGVGGFGNWYFYWSSTEADNSNALCQDFIDGYQHILIKGGSASVRAIRSF